jgi:hypothetical protein
MTRFAVLAVLTASMMLGSAAQAQRAVIMQNRDEPGRNPYQETKDCNRSFQCNFSVVPANYRRVIEHASCTYDQTGSSTAVHFGIASIGQNSVFYRDYIAGTLVDAARQIWVFNINTLVFFEAGETPGIIALYAVPTSSADLFCTLSGHDIALP